jgi:uridine kinase
MDGAGKTMFADELGLELERIGRRVVRTSIDDFLHPPTVRYRRGRWSPEGFWLDSYDYAAFEARVLDPYRRRLRSAVLVVDGIFLHRDELVDQWGFSIFLDVSVDNAYARMSKRDGVPASPADPANRRYVEGQRLYFAACRPWTRATVVIDNNDLAAPFAKLPRMKVRENQNCDARP